MRRRETSAEQSEHAHPDSQGSLGPGEDHCGLEGLACSRWRSAGGGRQLPGGLGTAGPCGRRFQLGHGPGDRCDAGGADRTGWELALPPHQSVHDSAAAVRSGARVGHHRPDCLLWPAAGRAGLHLAGTGQRSGNCTPALYPGRRPHRFWTGRTRHPWSLPRNSGGPGRRPASGGPGGAALDHVVPPVCRQSPHLLVRPDGVRLGSADGQPGAAGRQAVGDPR